MTQPTVAPVEEQNRIASIDVLRGVAVLGILLLNIQSFAMVIAAYFNPTAYGSLEGINGWVWTLTHLLGDQKFMSIFSMLFGAGIVLMADRIVSKGRSPVGIHYRRMGWLILFGFLHAHLLWYGDILWMYGWCGMLVFLIRRWPIGVLLGISAGLLIIGTGITLLWGWTMPFWGEQGLAGIAESFAPTQEVIQRQLDTYRGGWLDQAPARSAEARAMQTWVPFMSGYGWKVMALQILGVVLYRLGVFSAARSTGVYLVMLLVGLPVGLSLSGLGIHLHEKHDWDMFWSVWQGSLFNYWGALFTSLAYVALVMLVCRAGALLPVQRVLGAVGRMALTNYLMQTIICTTIFYGHGFGYFGHLERIEQVGVVVGIWTLQLIWSPLWLSIFRYGPFEWLWRSLSYWKRQPFLRRKGGGSTPSPTFPPTN